MTSVASLDAHGDMVTQQRPSQALETKVRSHDVGRTHTRTAPLHELCSLSSATFSLQSAELVSLAGGMVSFNWNLPLLVGNGLICPCSPPQLALLTNTWSRESARDPQSWRKGWRCAICTWSWQPFSLVLRFCVMVITSAWCLLNIELAEFLIFDCFLQLQPP